MERGERRKRRGGEVVRGEERGGGKSGRRGEGIKKNGRGRAKDYADGGKG